MVAAEDLVKFPSSFLVVGVDPVNAMKKTTSPVHHVKHGQSILKNQNLGTARLFHHLNEEQVNNHGLFLTDIHPCLASVGDQFKKKIILGSNARCMAFLYTIKMIIQRHVAPQNEELNMSLDMTIKNSIDSLRHFRPLPVSILNAFKYIKYLITQTPTNVIDSEGRRSLCAYLDAYITDQIDKAAEAISCTVQDKVSNDDVILTYGCSSLIYRILAEAKRRNRKFRVVLVDSHPMFEGQELGRRLTSKGIPCTYILINALGFIMPEVTKVLLGSHGLLANGCVMARTGTAQIALVARSFNVPILVCCETHKFSQKVQTDSIVFNELGNPESVINAPNIKNSRLMQWNSYKNLFPLNLIYDITPPELISAVITEVAILPCTSVPVILRIRPTEVMY